MDIETIRAQFPILNQQIGKNPLVYLDNAATTQKPLSVIEALDAYYRTTNANIHRGAHHLAHKATVAFENTRDQITQYLNAHDRAEIIFTSGTTESINLVAQTWGRMEIKAGDEILVSTLEHHSNIVPWQILAEEKGAHLKVIPVTLTGEWDWEVLPSLLTPRVKMVAVNHVSNSLGTIHDVERLIPLAHAVGAKVLLDGAQAVAHFKVDVRALDCDFYCFSGHKLYGPTGTGILYGKRDLLEAMPPYRGGGEMIKSVSFEKTTYNELPHKFEAGTPHIGGIIALGAAISFVNEIGFDTMLAHETALLSKATEAIKEIDGVRLYGTSSRKVGVLSFLVGEIHPYDLGTLLDQQGVAVRTGHHCTEPLWRYYQIPGTVRASFAIYNTMEEVDRFINALKKSVQLLQS